MKLESLSIRDFRGIKELDLDFKDDLGLIRDIIPIVGPNTSGKTTILDAIAFCLTPMTTDYRIRDGLRWSPTSLVRSGAVRANVTATLWFSNDEIEATREVFARSEVKGHLSLPSDGRILIKWTYPDPSEPGPRGSFRWEPAEGHLLSLGRRYVPLIHHVTGLGPRVLRRLGDVFMFDQHRSGLSYLLPIQEIKQVSELIDPDLLGRGNGKPPIEPLGQSGLGRTTDPRLILANLAMRAHFPQTPGATEKEDLDRLKTLYESVCYPHTMGNLINTEHGLDMEFQSDQGRYYFDGLSSGQQMILLMLLQFATRQLHRSIVLIDELELHLHPLWQDRLYGALPKLGDDNQYFFTTHSTHLRDTIRETFCHTTGDLNEPAVMS